jgi:ribosomal protein S18 acetylase RimI-like enzyme
MSSETKLRAMRHRDVWKAIDCEASSLERANGLQYAASASDIEYYLRQQYHRLTVAVDCHNIVRGYMHVDCGTGRNFARVKRIITHANWWRMGIARQLLSGLLRQCKDAQVDCICEVPATMLPDAANFLKRFSFKGTGLYSLDGDEYITMQWAAVLEPVEASCR